MTSGIFEEDITFAASKTNRSFSKTHKKLLQNGEKKIGTKLEKRENGMNGETLSG